MNYLLNSNQRVYKRISFISYISYSFAEYSNKEALKPFKQAILKNISAGGVFVELVDLSQSMLKKIFSDNYYFLIKFKLPVSSDFFVLKSKVRWSKTSNHYLEINRYGFGLQFVTIKAHSRNRLIDFVEGQQLK